MPSKKKRFRTKIVVGHEIDGSPITKWASGCTKKELAANKQQLNREYRTGVRFVQRDAVFRVYAQQYYDTYKKPKLKAASKANYLTAINRHVLPFIGDRQMAAVSAMDLQHILNQLNGRGKTLISDVIGILTSIFSHAYANGIIDRNPAAGFVRPVATKHLVRRGLTDEETKAVLELGKMHPDGLLLYLLYYTGLRKGEALGLQWGDIDFEKNELHVLRDIDYTIGDVDSVKSKAALRTIPIPSELMELLSPRHGESEAYVMQSPRSDRFWSHSTYDRRWKALMHELLLLAPGIEGRVLTQIKDKDGKKVDLYGSMLTAHYFRHNYASILHDAGVDVLYAQELLGHSDPATTMRIYTHLKQSKKESQYGIVQTAFSSFHDALRSRK